ASLRPTSLLALAGGISLIRELISTGNGSESEKCSHGSPSGNDMTSGNREKDRNATNDSPAGCSRRSMVRPFSTWPSSSASISPVPHRHPRRGGDRRRGRPAHRPGQRRRDQPGDPPAGRMPGVHGAGRQRAAQPLGLLGPARQLAVADRLVSQAQRLLATPVSVDELG